MTVLSDAAARWGVAAGILTTLALAAFAGALLSFVSLWRMRTDSRTIEAAERFEAVNLGPIIKRYVPPERQTQRAVEEIAIAKQAIAARQPRWQRAAMIAGLITVAGAAAASYAFRRHQTIIAETQPVENPWLDLDVLKEIQAVSGWSAAAGTAFVLSLVALVVAAVAAASLWRLRHAWQVMAAAERLEPVNLGAVIRRYVPGELHTQRFMDEIALARNIITDLRRRQQRIAAAAILILLLGATATTYSTQRHLKFAAAARQSQRPALYLDALNVVQGVWGWKADFLESCEQNPQVVSVSPDRRKLTVRYVKPFQSGDETVTDLNFDIVTTTGDSIVLSGTSSGRPSHVYIQFLGPDTFSLSRSDQPLGSSGTIIRCPPTQQVDPSLAH